MCTILVLNYHHRLASSDPMPQWVQTLFLQWIPWALRISRPGNKITRKSIHLQNKVIRKEIMLDHMIVSFLHNFIKDANLSFDFIQYFYFYTYFSNALIITIVSRIIGFIVILFTRNRFYGNGFN